MRPFRLGILASSVATATFVPTNIAGCLRWYAADNIVGLNDNDVVSSWNDESGNDVDAEQASGALQPVYKANILNGLPVVRFDGGDSLVGTSAFPLDVSRTVFVVARQSVNGGEACIFDVGSLMALTAAGDTWKWYGNNPDVFTGPDLLWSVISVPQDDTTGGDVFVNGVSALSLGNAVSGGGSGVLSLGSANGPSLHFEGDIAEIIIYDTKLSTEDRETVEAYLTDKYGL